MRKKYIEQHRAIFFDQIREEEKENIEKVRLKKARIKRIKLRNNFLFLVEIVGKFFAAVLLTVIASLFVSIILTAVNNDITIYESFMLFWNKLIDYFC